MLSSSAHKSKTGVLCVISRCAREPTRREHEGTSSYCFVQRRTRRVYCIALPPRSRNCCTVGGEHREGHGAGTHLLLDLHLLQLGAVEPTTGFKKREQFLITETWSHCECTGFGFRRSNDDARCERRSHLKELSSRRRWPRLGSTCSHNYRQCVDPVN